MHELRRYRKRASQYVTAVQLDLDTEGFRYRKWGDVQRCERGDWIVDNQGDIYTVRGEVFARTYRELSPGAFVKTTPIFGRRAAEDGSLETHEGRSHYRAGDYIVSESEDGAGAYCIGAAKFCEMYEQDESQ